MNSDIFGKNDKDLISAVKMFEAEKLASYPNEKELAENALYSAHHQRRMSRMLTGHDRFIYRITSTGKRSLMTACVVFLALFNTLMITNVEARQAVRDFIVTVYEEFSAVLFTREGDVTPVTEHFEPTYIPSGYSVTYTESSELHYLVEYMNNSDQLILYQQVTLDDSYMQIDTEDSVIEQIYINGIEGLIVYNKGVYSLHFDNGYFAFNIVGESREEIVKMAESIKF